MDYGLAQSLHGLNYGPSKRDQAREELATLEAIRNDTLRQRKEEEIAQIEEQQYYDDISKQASLLLEPDFKKVNEKAKILAKKIKESIRSTGGSTSSFFRNGGRKLMNEYKNSILNSPEMIGYKSNKSNLERILDIQAKGKGHLINQNDMEKLRNYQENKSGEITFTGLLAEIEPIDTSMYDYGQQIPYRDILHYGDNYVKIMGNYITTFGNPNPSEEDLISYVAKNYANQTGSNWQKVETQKREENRHIEKMASIKSKDQLDKAKIIQKNRDLKYKYDALDEKSSGSKGKSSSKKTRSSSLGIDQPAGIRDKEYRNSVIANTRKIQGYLPKGITAQTFKDGYFEDPNYAYKTQMNEYLGPKVTDAYSEYNLDEKGIDISTDGVGFIEGLFNNNYSIRNSYRMFPGLHDIVAKTVLNLDDDSFDTKNMIVSDFIPNKDWYSSKGVRLGDMKNEIEYDEYKSNYKILDIQSGALVDTSNQDGLNQSNIVMSVYDDKQLDEELTNELTNGYGNSEIKNEGFIAIQKLNEDGEGEEVFYVPIGVNNIPQSNAIYRDLDQYDDATDMVKDQYETDVISESASKINAEKEMQLQSFYDTIQGNTDIMKPVFSESKMLSKEGVYDGVRDSFIKSFYGATASFLDSTPEDFMSSASEFDLTTTLQELSNDHGVDYIKLVKDYNYNDEEIIKMIIEKTSNAQEKNIYRNWYDNYRYLNS